MVKGGTTFTPVFKGGLGNILYQISVCISLACDRGGQAIFYKQLSEKEKKYSPFGGHSLGEKEGLPKSLQEVFPKLLFFDQPYTSSEIKKKGLIFNESSSLFYKTIPSKPGRNLLEGYFFDYRHFGHNLAHIVDQLLPADSITEYIDKKYKNLFAGKTVSLHLRMGNENDNFDVVAIPSAWYLNVFKKLSAKTTFLVCSDNMEKAKTFLMKFPIKRKFVFIEEEPMFVDMFVMSRCDHNILHNSTLSVWSAFLNRNKRKKVFYHDPLFASIHGKGSIAPQWKNPDPLLKRISKQWHKKYRPAIKDELLRQKRALQTHKRDFLHRVFGIYYILDHEKEINQKELNS